jgi:triacylglycerol lipase
MNIVLVHGFLGFREKYGIEYFRGVAEHFRAKSLKVLVPELDPIRGIAFRGGQLRDQIVAAHKTGDLDPNEQNHIIAHSMGGLDSRFILSPVNPGRIQIPVRSLTTISTPHRGSPIADILDSPEQLDPFPHLAFRPRGRPLDDPLDAMGTSSDGLRDLTTTACTEFSAKYTNNPAVAYFSVAGRGRPNFPPTAAALIQFYSYIGALTGELNDGLVSVPSAQWGTFDLETWPADHAEEVGHNLDNMLVPPAFPYLAKYDQIVARVANLT